MELWEQLIKAALLGTQKFNQDDIPFPASLQSVLATLKAQNSDREDLFLKTTIIALQYTSAGTAFPVISTPLPAACEEEVLPVCPREVTEILRRILYEKQDSLLELLLQKLITYQVRITPELIPGLLDKAKDDKEIRRYVLQVTGKRGAWLSALNPGWHYLTPVSSEEIWETANAEERKEALLQIRSHAPAQAREWLLSTWKTEKSVTKASFLNVFAMQLSMEDEPMLEEMLHEKARTVKDVAESLLFRLSDSRLVNRLWERAHKWIHLTKKATLTGSGYQMHISLPDALPKELEQDGILAAKDKFLTQGQHKFTAHPALRSFHHLVLEGTSEAESWLYQVFLVVPPDRWRIYLKTDDKTFIQLFLSEEYSYLIPALVNAAVLHKSYSFIQAILPLYQSKNRFMALSRDKSGYYLKYNLIAGLPVSEKRAYEHELLTLLEEDDFQFYSYLQVYDYEWSIDFALTVLKKIAEKCSSGKYYYHFYDSRQIQKLSHYLPTGVCLQWEKLQPADDMGKVRWQQATALLFNTMDLKRRVAIAFNET